MMADEARGTGGEPIETEVEYYVNGRWIDSEESIPGPPAPGPDDKEGVPGDQAGTGAHPTGYGRSPGAHVPGERR